MSENTSALPAEKSGLNPDLVCELELSDLAPLYGTPAFKDTSGVKPRSFAALQRRARNAVRHFLLSPERSLLLLCGNAYMDMSAISSDLVEECAGQAPIIAYAPTRFEMFGNDQTDGILTAPGVVVMPCVHLIDHPKRLGMTEACLKENHQLKLVLYGDPTDCSQLAMLWPYLENATRSDLVQEFPAKGGLPLMAALVHSIVKKGFLKHFDAEAVELLALYCCRESGDKNTLSIPQMRLESIVHEAASYEKGPAVGRRAVVRTLAAMDFRENYPGVAVLREHRDRQILISTQGEMTGQINGLSVVETAGTSYIYGEPLRITATLRAGGEGDVIDIERKAELAGQIHAKAMMIINGYLTKEFGSREPLPVSASLVFEQSYSEIDGDSASLTGLCAVISCLAELPIRQDLAVTGAVDQFGDVQPVGGVNEKIEGFFKICRLHGLTGTQGVIIPNSCVNQLVLRPAVLKAMAEGKFHIYTVNHVRGAVRILTGYEWGDETKEDTVCGRICDHLSDIGPKPPKPWWRFGF